jgi:hypothetical protein
MLRRHRVSNTAPTRGDRRTVKGRATCRSMPRLMPCLGFFLPPSTRGGAATGTARGSRSTALARSGRHLGITRYTAGFSLDHLSCDDNLSLRIFDAQSGRRRHVHPRFPMALIRVTRPCTRSRAMRRSSLSPGQRRSTPPSRNTHPRLRPPRTRLARPCTRSRATRRSPLSPGRRRRTPISRLRSSRYPIFPGHDGSRRAAPVGEVVNLRRGDIDLDVAGRLAICLRATHGRA